MPKEYSRIDRIGDLIQRELAQLLIKEMQDPRLDLVTITAVKVSKDLSFAKVYFTQAKEEKAALETVKVLNRAANHLRYLLAQAIDLRVVPHLRFYYDTSISNAAHLSGLINSAIAADEDKHKK